MTAKDLERLLTQHGIGVAKLDAVTRKLRAAGHLPKGGRGSNAPHITATEAALVLIAVAGSAKGIEADARIEKLLPMSSTKSPRAQRTLLDAVSELLGQGFDLTEVAELRVGRTSRYAAIHSTNGEIEEFVRTSTNTHSDRFSVEGIVPRSLLKRIALGLLPANTRDLEP